MTRLAKFFMAAAELIPTAGAVEGRRLVVRVIQADNREQAVTAFLGNLRADRPNGHAGLIEVVEMPAPLLNTIAVHVVGDEVNVQAPKLVHDIIARHSAAIVTGDVSDD